MKSQAVQNLIKSIFSDEKTKEQFLSNPNRVLAQFNLTEQEKKAVLQTQTKLGLVTAGSAELEAVVDPAAPWHAPMP